MAMTFTFLGATSLTTSSIVSMTTVGKVEINPTSTFNDIGTYTITVTISDGQPLSTTQVFVVDLINTAPYFIQSVASSIDIKFNLTFEYIIPPTKDDDGDTVTYFILSTPSIDAFLTMRNDRFILNPTLWS